MTIGINTKTRLACITLIYALAVWFPIFALAQSSQKSINYNNTRVLRAVDGDTFELRALWLPRELGNRLYLRIEGIDTPERKAKCEKERIAANNATYRATQLLQQAKHAMPHVTGWDKYGGRVVGELLIDGIPFSQIMIKEGYARPYNGGAKKSWCN
jgi:endonuclease YncB( thermonuclease family)